MNISQVAEKMNIPASTIRYYEKIGLLAPIKRNKNGVRKFVEGDLEQINFVGYMTAAGLPLKTLKIYLDLVSQGDDTLEERKKILVKERLAIEKKREEIDEVLSLLNHKISHYETNLSQIKNVEN